jgi:hypothetical protein
MKYLLICLFTVGILFASSCSKEILEKDETGDLTLDIIYSDINLADEVLNNLYSRVRSLFRNGINEYAAFSAGAYLDCGTVYGQPQMNWSSAIVFNSGGWNSSNCWFNSGTNIVDGRIYPVNYNSIRAAWLFLENIEKVPFDAEYGYGPEQLEQKKGEAYFLLAWFHHELVSFYGGITLVKELMETGSEAATGPRNTYDECVDYMVELCEKAADLLPSEWPGNELGRVTSGAAIALKSRILLYAASPLFNNPDKPEDSPFRGKYDPAKWEIAAQAAWDVISSDRYSLHPDIAELFVMETNSESIFQRMYYPSRSLEHADLPPEVGSNGNKGRNQVTYNLFKNYKVLVDGKAYDQDDPNSGWDLQDPYENLDPRFYRDIVFNGCWSKAYSPVELWEAEPGVAPARSITPNNCSFLILRKFTDPNITAWVGAAFHNKIYIRYAEILLNYAEAMNEAYGPEVDGLGNGFTAIDAVNLIRRRTKFTDHELFQGRTGEMPDFPTGLSKNEFRKELMQERKIELCFERSLFFDLRRWREDPESQRTAYWLVPKKDMEGDITFSLKPQTRAFTTAWYLMPIADDEILLNSNLVQNPGWTGSPEAQN